MTGIDDSEGMALAIAAADAPHPSVSPNPRVGCAIVTIEGVIHTGATEPPPGRHAERVALDAAGEDARGATAFVTLEPCGHHGRTPPCADALIDSGVDRVVVAIEDPDPLVAGEGVELLREAGVSVDVGERTDEVEAQLAAYLTHRRTGRPYVTLKLAATLDGRTAAPDRTSQWITGEAARADAHRLRAESDAILVGAGTVRADDPSLTVRHVDGTDPLRVVLGQAPSQARVHPCREMSGELPEILDELGADERGATPRRRRSDGGSRLPSSRPRRPLRGVPRPGPDGRRRRSGPVRRTGGHHDRRRVAGPHHRCGSPRRRPPDRPAPEPRTRRPLMFTGIIEELGTVTSFVDGRLRIEASKVLDDVEMGASIAVNGVCLTVVAHGDHWWEADVVDESLKKSSLGVLEPGHRVNLERPVRVADRLGGHLVQGHVDGVGRILTPAPDLHVRCEPALTRYIVEKGSITIDGISLTVVDVFDDGFTVAIIPHTGEVTTLGFKGEDDPVNLEVDLTAKYVEKLLAWKD